MAFFCSISLYIFLGKTKKKKKKAFKSQTEHQKGRVDCCVMLGLYNAQVGEREPLLFFRPLFDQQSLSEDGHLAQFWNTTIFFFFSSTIFPFTTVCVHITVDKNERDPPLGFKKTKK